MPTINFTNPNRDAGKISNYSRNVLFDIMLASGIPQITITSTTRTASDQAKIMYENIELYGVAHQKKLYGTYGDKVIDEYFALKQRTRNKASIISGMTAKIISVGPHRVSKHAANPSRLNVIDIAPSSVPVAFRKRMESAVK